MYLDADLLFSENQALTGNAASTNVVDLGVARDMGPGNPLPLVIQVTEDFTGTSPTLKADFETDDNAAFSSAKVLASSQTLSDPKAGDKLGLTVVPDGTERYVRINYTVGGTTPSGKVTAGIVLDRQTAKSG